MKVAILLTCHNRRDLTRRLMDSLAISLREAAWEYQIFANDDGSTDGTNEIIKAAIEGSIVINGSGDDYWNGGMNRAWKTAKGQGFENFLWLNDDVVLFPDAIPLLEEEVEATGHSELVVGAVRDSSGIDRTYGRVAMQGPNIIGNISYRVMSEMERNLPANTMHGNCVFVPKVAFDELGMLDPYFKHQMGDFDYGVRACQKGIGISECASIVGICDEHPFSGSLYDASLQSGQLTRQMKHPTGMPSPLEWTRFVSRISVWKAPIVFLRAGIRVMFPRIWALFRQSDDEPSQRFGRD